VKTVFREMIDLAADFGKIANIGRVRGQIGNRPRQVVEDLFVAVARELCDYALPKGVTLILEPVNRYETDFINSVEEGIEVMKKIDRKNMMLMPDTFHMNIEDKQIGPVLAKNIDYIKYIHFADSNRLAPGEGNLNFQEIFDYLLEAKYDGWITAEILPDPDPDTAASQTASFLIPLIKEYNEKRAHFDA
jgi:sugar phosphate isomerase/epimerase